MCCEDVQIDYAKNGVGRLLALTTGSIQLVSPDQYRYSLMIGQVSSGNAWITTDQPAVVGNGFQMATVQAPLFLSREMVGDLVGKAWYIIHSAGGVNIWVVETFLLPGGPCGNYLQSKSGQLYAGSGGGKPTGTAKAKGVAPAF